MRHHVRVCIGRRAIDKTNTHKLCTNRHKCVQINKSTHMCTNQHKCAYINLSRDVLLDLLFDLVDAGLLLALRHPRMLQNLKFFFRIFFSEFFFSRTASSKDAPEPEKKVREKRKNKENPFSHTASFRDAPERIRSLYVRSLYVRRCLDLLLLLLIL